MCMHLNSCAQKGIILGKHALQLQSHHNLITQTYSVNCLHVSNVT